MTGEEIPLLGTQHDHIYDRFSPRQKRFLVAIVSWGGLVACMSVISGLESQLSILQFSALELLCPRFLRSRKTLTQRARLSGT